jgi:hypothetical protein
LVEWLPSGVWGQSADFLLGVGMDVLDAFASNPDSSVVDRERGVFLLLGRHVRGVGLGERENQLVQARPLAMERIPDDKGQFVRERLQQFCVQHEAPFAIGLLKDSIAVARPVGDKCFDLVSAELCPGELTAVTQ